MSTSGTITLTSVPDIGIQPELRQIASVGNFISFATSIAGVILIRPRKFGDHRGCFAETYSAEQYRALGVDASFVQDNQSLSATRGTVRGLHFQVPPAAQAKLVRVLRGSILDVAVDLRRRSPTFGRHVKAVLSCDNFHQLYIPTGFAHGFLTLEPNTEVLYKVSSYYSPSHERGITFDDPSLDIDWGISRDEATLSAKDMHYPHLAANQPAF